MPRHASTTVKLAALAMAAPALLLPMKAAGQQMALGGPRSTDEIVATCVKSHQPNQGAIAECIVRVGTEENKRASAEARARSAAADARGAAAESQTACSNEIGVLRRNETYGAQATEIAREIVKASGRPALEHDACQLRDGIRAGLTKQKRLPERVSLN
jgi:hypothetical protein